ncbi:hypothetical protein LUZ60_010231 [Juncus effusus]|nr:hypothetical protein LUZ60_010231 [Juncus effusus]
MNSIAAPSSSSLFLSHHPRPFLPPTFISIARTTKSGICSAVQTSADFFRSEVVVREARAEDAWQVADTHCSSFYPHFKFPIDLILKVYRVVGMLNRIGAPSASGPFASCLVAVRDEAKIGGFDWILGFDQPYVAGVITVDSVAEFLPRKGPSKERRKGIAYISNVAVRQADRRKGIATKLVAGAESLARKWGCRSVALHCDKRNIAAVKLYESRGFKSVRVPENAQWPEPRAPPGTDFAFMIKLLK